MYLYKEALLPSSFSALTRSDWWAKISTLYLRLESQKDWLCLKRMLVHFDKLKSLGLIINWHGEDWAESDVATPLRFPPLNYMSFAFYSEVAHGATDWFCPIARYILSFLLHGVKIN